MRKIELILATASSPWYTIRESGDYQESQLGYCKSSRTSVGQGGSLGGSNGGTCGGHVYKEED